MAKSNYDYVRLRSVLDHDILMRESEKSIMKKLIGNISSLDPTKLEELRFKCQEKGFIERPCENKIAAFFLRNNIRFLHKAYFSFDSHIYFMDFYLPEHNIGINILGVLRKGQNKKKSIRYWGIKSKGVKPLEISLDHANSEVILFRWLKKQLPSKVGRQFYNSNFSFSPDIQAVFINQKFKKNISPWSRLLKIEMDAFNDDIAFMLKKGGVPRNKISCLEERRFKKLHQKNDSLTFLASEIMKYKIEFVRSMAFWVDAKIFFIDLYLNTLNIAIIIKNNTNGHFKDVSAFYSDFLQVRGLKCYLVTPKTIKNPNLLDSFLKSIGLTKPLKSRKNKYTYFASATNKLYNEEETPY